MREPLENKFKDNFSLNKELNDIVSEAIEVFNSKKLQEADVDLFGGISLSILAKNRKHYNSVQELCKLGFGEEAGLIVRSMTNALIDLTYIFRCGKDELSERFVRFDWVVKRHKIAIADMLDEHTYFIKKDQKKTEQWEQRREEVEAEVEKFYKDYKCEQTKHDWSGYSIKTKAKKAGKEIELLYNTVYRYNSDIEHSNATALNNYVKTDVPGSMQFMSEPGENHVEENLRESFNIYLRIAIIFFDYFKLSEFSEKASKLTAEFLKIYKKE
ncbi:MAG: DUF5677 domain-containing protein [Candidatus Zapsychrus exili]|nr:DUF5677 domain-containing protein [Candidatus Zapsychrus exili]